MTPPELDLEAIMEKIRKEVHLRKARSRSSSYSLDGFHVSDFFSEHNSYNLVYSATTHLLIQHPKTTLK